jgi:hypothetical protein
MLEDLILIDQLEDQIIDHPDASTTRELNETSLDETFQSKLKAMADQIQSNQTSSGNPNTSGEINYQFLHFKSHLNYKYSDYGELKSELNEWFTYDDLRVVGGLNQLYTNYKSAIDESGNQEKVIQNALDGIRCCDLLVKTLAFSKSLGHLTYFSFGEYAGRNSQTEQLRYIKLNVETLILQRFYDPLIDMVKRFLLDIQGHRIETPFDAVVESNYFRALTLLYFMINVLLTTRNEAFIETLNELDLLSAIVKFIEFWKWKPNKHYKIRYLLMLVWKLILLEMGDSQHLAACDDFLHQLHNIKHRNEEYLSQHKLSCSPLDYYAFREDLIDKYPLYKTKQFDSKDFSSVADIPDGTKHFKRSKVPASVEENYKYFMAMNSFSNSLSNLIESPRTNKSHTVLSQLPSQTVHIATPVPSPNLMASDYMTGGEKIRRSYQVNQAMPFIYPNVNSTVDNTENTEVPYALKQADEILKSSIYESYSTKRLWYERQKFMKQERGFVNEYEVDDLDEFEYDELLFRKYPEKKREIMSILRVEKFYSKTLSHMHTFIQVLVETIKANKNEYNLNYVECELNPETSYFNNSTKFNTNKASAKKSVDFVLMLQLEVINTKEITLKASTGIIALLLKWFKINHVLKHHYLTSILFDQQFFTISLDFIGRGFNNNNLKTPTKLIEETNELSEYESLINENKIMNPQIRIPNFEFFNNCLNDFPKEWTFELINKNFILTMPKIQDANNTNNVYIERYNENYCFVLANILSINNKILIKNSSQRIFTLNELKPSELYKMILINYDNKAFSIPILKTLKKLVPYQGRKWKSINMDLISQIYLNLRLSLKDNWLSGKDLESDFNNSYDQEIALRAILQFYNMRKYPKQMESIGYHLSRDLPIPTFDLNSVDLN